MAFLRSAFFIVFFEYFLICPRLISGQLVEEDPLHEREHFRLWVDKKVYGEILYVVPRLWKDDAEFTKLVQAKIAELNKLPEWTAMSDLHRAELADDMLEEVKRMEDGRRIREREAEKRALSKHKEQEWEQERKDREEEMNTLHQDIILHNVMLDTLTDGTKTLREMKMQKLEM